MKHWPQLSSGCVLSSARIWLVVQHLEFWLADRVKCPATLAVPSKHWPLQLLFSKTCLTVVKAFQRPDVPVLESLQTVCALIRKPKTILLLPWAVTGLINHYGIPCTVLWLLSTKFDPRLFKISFCMSWDIHLYCWVKTTTVAQWPSIALSGRANCLNWQLSQSYLVQPILLGYR